MADPIILKIKEEKIVLRAEEEPIVLKETGQGMPGKDGITPDISIGTVRTVDPDQPADVRKSGTPQNVILDFDIPKGESGIGSWGEIEGTLSDQTDLQEALDSKADVIITQASGDILKITDNGNYPVISLNAELKTLQEGSGDPSSTNIRPITGWTGVTINSYSKNMLIGDDPEDPDVNYTASSSGDIVTYHADEDCYECINRGVGYAKHSGETNKLFIAPADMTITFSIYTKNLGTTYGLRLYKNGTRLTDIHGDADSVWHRNSLTMYLKKGDYLSITFYGDIYWRKMQIEIGPSMTEYQPYEKSSVTVSWENTVYGGVADLKNGILTVTDGYIASYNGETLPGEWISDRDVYAEGTSPTVGAEVVYKLSEHLTYSFTALQDITLDGSTLIADTGKLTAQYKADTKEYIDNSRTYYVKGTQISSTSDWTGNLPQVEELYEGLAIDYWLPFAGNGNATLTLTLKNGKTDPIPVYYGDTNRVSSTQPVYTVWRYVYQTIKVREVDYTGWWAVRAYDSNTTYSYFTNLIHNKGNFIADSIIYRYQLLFHTDEDTLTPLTNANNVTAATKTMLTNVAFDPFAEIFYYNATGTISSGAAVGANNLTWNFDNADLRYSLNCGSTLTANKDVYLKVIMQSDGKCKLASDPCWTQTLPSTADGYHYIYLGRAFSTTGLSFYYYHPVFYHDGTSIKIMQNPKIAGSGGGGGGTWGSITGTLSNQTDLQNALNAKADTADLGGIVVRPDYTISNVDLTDGTSSLETGKLYFYYE